MRTPTHRYYTHLSISLLNHVPTVVRTNQAQQRENDEDAKSDITVTLTDSCTNNVEKRTSAANLSTTITRQKMDAQSASVSSHETNKSIRKQNGGSTKTITTQNYTKGTVSNGTADHSSDRGPNVTTTTVTTTTRTITNGVSDKGKKVCTAHGKADATVSKSVDSDTKTVVHSDGTAVTTTTSTKTSSVHYVVEANATREKIIR